FGPSGVQEEAGTSGVKRETAGVDRGPICALAERLKARTPERLIMRRLVVGISGSSAPIYGIRLLEVLAADPEVETHLVMSRAAERTIALEAPEWTPARVAALASCVYEAEDVAAAISSGSFRTDGMVIIPCSMKTLAGVAQSLSLNLLLRAADVTLKERR